MATETSKRSSFRTPLANERVNGFQTLRKSARHHHYPLFSSVRGKLTCKKSPSVWYEILRLFVKALTADDKYSGSNMKNLPQHFQTPLSQKQKTFSEFFIAFLKCYLQHFQTWLFLNFLLHFWFLKCAWYLEHFQKKDKYPSRIISELIDAKRRGYLNV